MFLLLTCICVERYSYETTHLKFKKKNIIQFIYFKTFIIQGHDINY